MDNGLIANDDWSIWGHLNNTDTQICAQQVQEKPSKKCQNCYKVSFLQVKFSMGWFHAASVILQIKNTEESNYLLIVRYDA